MFNALTAIAGGEGSSSGTRGGGETISDGDRERLRDLVDRGFCRWGRVSDELDRGDRLSGAWSRAYQTWTRSNFYLADWLGLEARTLNVCWTDKELPNGKTALRIDTQVWVREPKYVRMPEEDRAYLWGHEAMHGLVPREITGEDRAGRIGSVLQALRDGGDVALSLEMNGLDVALTRRPQARRVADAVTRRDLPALQTALAQAAIPVDARDPVTGLPPVGQAAVLGWSEGLATLLAARAPVPELGAAWHEPLEWTIWKAVVRHPDALRAALAHPELDPNMRFSRSVRVEEFSFWTLSTRSVEIGDPSRYRPTWTPLAEAAFTGASESLEALLSDPRVDRHARFLYRGELVVYSDLGR
jgi:hypothetical protein